jgi:hypothetical protein
MMPPTQLLPLSLVALLSSALTVVGMQLVAPSVSRGAPDPQTRLPVVQAERFELLDLDGNVRAALSTSALPAGGLSTQLTLYGDAPPTPGVVTSMVSMSAAPSNSYLFVLGGGEARTEAGLVASRIGERPQVGLEIVERNHDRAGIGAGILRGPAASQTYSVFIADTDGQVIWQEP